VLHKAASVEQLSSHLLGRTMAQAAQAQHGPLPLRSARRANGPGATAGIPSA
jgi:cation transport ATPase